jgi:asparagine synthase (glutamine-hydrolysing)
LLSAEGPGAALASDPASGLSLAFDGRIDDREGLRRDLAQAGDDGSAAPDAELALRILRRFGPEGGAARITGEFAFVLSDPRTGTQSAGRDVLGIRPLLLHERAGRAFFATRTAALVAAAGIPVEPDEAVAAEVLAGGPYHPSAGLVRGVRHVVAGTILTVGSGVVRETRFRSVDPAGAPADVDAFRAALREAVRCRLPGSGPVALNLSGGIDSAAVAAFAAAEGAEVRAFTVGFPGLPCDEEEAARETAAALGIRHEVIPWTPAGPARIEEECARTLDLPDLPPSMGFDGVAARIRAEGIPVVLDGEGGDGCFDESIFLAADLLGEGEFSAAWREAGRWSDGVAGRARILRDGGLRPLLPARLRAALRGLRGSAPVPPWIDRDLAQRTGLAERIREEAPAAGPGGFARGHVASFLGSGWSVRARGTLDLWGVRTGAEPRHPFLDLRVLETALALPPELRGHGDLPRAALRQSLEGLLPDAVRLRRGKADFTPVILHVLGAVGWHPEPPPTTRLAAAGWLDPAGLASMPASVPGLWSCFALESWLRACVPESGNVAGVRVRT